MSANERVSRRRTSLFGELTKTVNGFSINYPDDYEEKLSKETTEWEIFNQKVHEKLKLPQQCLKLNSALTKNDLNQIDEKYRKVILQSLNFDRFKQTSEEFLIKQQILDDMKQSFTNDEIRLKLQSLPVDF